MTINISNREYTWQGSDKDRLDRVRPAAAGTLSGLTPLNPGIQDRIRNLYRRNRIGHIVYPHDVGAV